MSRNVEELLRQGLDRATADAELPEPPAQLLRRARHHNRRRREAIAGALAAGGAAIAAAATFLTTAVPVVSVSGQTINYVTTRAERALAQLDPGKAIEIDTVTVHNSHFTLDVQSTAANGQNNVNPQPKTMLSQVRATREVVYSYGDLQLSQGFSPTGHLVFTSTYTPVSTGHGKPVLEAYGAAYPVRTQWHTPLTGGPDWPNPPLTCGNAGFSYPSWQQGIKKALSCHLFKLAGNQNVNGIDALKLVRKFDGSSTLTLWVDPATYLPVRMTSQYPGFSGQRITETADLSWLSPTQANLDRLRAAEQRGVVPAGFHQLPSTDFPLVLVASPELPG